MSSQMVLVWIALTCVTLLTRVGPLVCGRWLEKQEWVSRIASQLPCMILILLLLHEMEAMALPVGPNTIASLLGLIVTLAVNVLCRQVILGIAAGTATYIALLWFLAT